MIALANAGRLHIDVAPFTFDRIEEAYGLVEAGTLAGRAVVTLT